MEPRRLNPVIIGTENNYKDFRPKVTDADPKGSSAPEYVKELPQGPVLPPKSTDPLKETDSGFRLVPPSQLKDSLPVAPEQPVSAERAAKPPSTTTN